MCLPPFAADPFLARNAALLLHRRGFYAAKPVVRHEFDEVPYACRLSPVAAVTAVAEQSGMCSVLYDDAPFSWHAHQNAVLDVAWSGTDALLATASSDCTAKVWDLARFTCVADLRPDAGYCTAVCFAPSNPESLLVVGVKSGAVQQWDVRQSTQRPAASMRVSQRNSASHPTQIAYLPFTDNLLVLCQEAVVLYDRRFFKRILSWTPAPPLSRGFVSMAHDSNGNCVFVLMKNGHIAALESCSLRRTSEFSCASFEASFFTKIACFDVGARTFLASGTEAVAADGNAAFLLWDVENRHCQRFDRASFCDENGQRNFFAFEKSVTCVDAHSQSSKIAVCSDDRSCVVNVLEAMTADASGPLRESCDFIDVCIADVQNSVFSQTPTKKRPVQSALDTFFSP